MRFALPGLATVCCASMIALAPAPLRAADPIQVSGRYPHLAMTNHYGECGTGAVVPWADRLWVITYAPHEPGGSNDKLYEVDDQLHRVTRPESIGGTPADRLIHDESQQLIIGPYFIDAQRHVRVIGHDKIYARLTAAARHLTDPADKIYLYGMEGMVWEVNVHNLDTKLLFKKPIPGWHGKGAYTGQGRLVLANNGREPAATANRYKPFDYFIKPVHHSVEDSGALAEWLGGKQWHLIQRHQFTDITGPGGIHGSPSPDAPLWAIGWDKRSVMLEMCDYGKWSLYRLPKADLSYDGWHGWYTEWPRIRQVSEAGETNPAKFLMNMHGGWFDFPQGFRAGHTGGLRPIGSYLKITGDFAPWHGRIVFGCDDASVMQNPLAMQSQSNLWFSDWAGLHHKGPVGGTGGVWVDDDVKAGAWSDPFLFAGYSRRVLHLAHGSAEPVTFTVQIDRDGRGNWTDAGHVTVGPRGYAFHVFPADQAGEWVRLSPDRDAEKVTAVFDMAGDEPTHDASIFNSLAKAGESGERTTGPLRPLGSDTGRLQFLADGDTESASYYEVDGRLRFAKKSTKENAAVSMAKAATLVPHVTEDDASLILTMGKGKKRETVRLPIGNPAFAKGGAAASVPGRDLREVVTERFLLNAGGSFFVVPRDNSRGLLGIKPISTHGRLISDFTSWRGLLVISGANRGASPDGHYFAAGDGSGAGLWFGDIDDLWSFGKPVGRGGPWKDTSVEAGVPSMAYLISGYDRKKVELSHNGGEPVTFTIEVDVTASGAWHKYASITVPAGKTVTHVFPKGYAADWVRVVADQPCRATATFIYE